MPAAKRWNSRSAKKNKKLLRSLHLESAGCALASNDCQGAITLHHVLGGKYGREDHVSNIVRLCAYGHHEKITNNDAEARMELGLHILKERPDVIAYVRDRLGPVTGDDWLRRRLFIEL